MVLDELCTAVERAAAGHVELLIVLIGSELASFIVLSASTASPRTSVELDHSSGSSKVEENTTFDTLPRRSAVACSSAPEA